MSNRKWNKGNPPHVGWWNASASCASDVWRWWNGKYWSGHATEDTEIKYVELSALVEQSAFGEIMWTDYWPENARVPRINPDKEK